jgi:hypothetical protein
MISKNMTSRIFQAQTGVRLLCLRGSLVGDAPRCSVAKKPAAISSVHGRTDLTSTSSSTSTLTLLPYRINLYPEAPIKDKRHPSAGSECLSPDQFLLSRSSVRVRSSRNRLPANSCTLPPSRLALERHLPQSPISA